ASDNPKLFLAINKDPTASQWATTRLLGLTSGRVSVWRKDTSMPFAAPPSRLGTVDFGNGTFSYPLPPLSVTAFVVAAATAASATPAAAGQPVAQDTFQRPDQPQWGQASDGD